MNVLEVSVRSDIGGGPKHLLDQLIEFKSLGVNAYSAIPYSGEYAPDILKESLGSIEVPFRSFHFLTLFKLISFARRHEIHVIHSHGRGAGVYSRLMKLFGFKVVHTFHGIHIESTLTGKIKLLADMILRHLTDKFICVSESEKMDAIKFGIASISKTYVIHNGVHVQRIEYNPHNEIVTLGTLSRLNYQKGIDTLISYIQKFISQNKFNFKIKIAGDGELEKELKEKLRTSSAKNYIEFVGATSSPLEFLASLDGYISFARWEGMPLAVLEAMAVGVPCLLSNVQGNKDLVTRDIDGQLFDLNDYKSFEKEMLIFFNDESKRKAYSERAKLKIYTDFGRKSMSKKTMELYK